MPYDALCQHLQQLRQEIQRCVAESGRSDDSVRLIAVSKTHSVDRIRAAYACGQRAFGENYAQELTDKARQLADLAIEWHFVGPIQSNKTRLIAAHAAWVHSVDRIQIAERLVAHRPLERPALQVCLQVNIDKETSKSGVAVDELPALARQVAALDPARLRLRGLMCIPRPDAETSDQRTPFRRLHGALMELRDAGLTLDTLSMGMSGDYRAAIAEGATLIRIGTAIFGARH